MPKTRVQKEETVQHLTDKLQKARAVVFADYKGMTMSQISELRDKLREVSAEFSVTKNTLMERAAKQAGLSINNPQILEGPTATLLAYEDQISPIKALVKAFKDAGLGAVKGGFLDKEGLSTARVTQLSTLPGKEELRAQAVGLIASPLRGIVGVLSANLRNLVIVLDQVKVAKGGE